MLEIERVHDQNAAPQITIAVGPGFFGREWKQHLAVGFEVIPVSVLHTKAATLWEPESDAHPGELL